MKYLKTYEQNITQPIVGQYVIMNVHRTNPHPTLTNYLSNNIGKIVGVSNIFNNKEYAVVKVKFENVPAELHDIFNMNINRTSGVGSFSYKTIEHISYNIEDLKIIIKANNYNL